MSGKAIKEDTVIMSPFNKSLERSQIKLLLVSVVLICCSFIAGIYYAEENQFNKLVFLLVFGGLTFVSALAFLLIKKRFLYFFLLLLPGTLFCFVDIMWTGPMSQQEQELALKMQSLERQMSDAEEGIVYLLRDIPKDHLISDDDIGIKQIERTGLPKLLVARKYEVVGLRTTRPIQAGAILTSDDIATPTINRTKIAN